MLFSAPPFVCKSTNRCHPHPHPHPHPHQCRLFCCDSGSRAELCESQCVRLYFSRQSYFADDIQSHSYVCRMEMGLYMAIIMALANQSHDNIAHCVCVCVCVFSLMSGLVLEPALAVLNVFATQCATVELLIMVHCTLLLFTANRSILLFFGYAQYLR